VLTLMVRSCWVSLACLDRVNVVAFSCFGAREVHNRDAVEEAGLIVSAVVQSISVYPLRGLKCVRQRWL
jgi:hypothetical protein